MITYFCSIYNMQEHAHIVATSRKKLTFDNNNILCYTLNIHLVFTHDFGSTIFSCNAVKIGTVSGPRDEGLENALPHFSQV